jgi:F-type H+-transporting ATPase subunit b
MLIDWFTVGAQALNFLILVGLMKRFLYKPILHAVDAREKLIAGQLAAAETKKTEAQKERDTFGQKNTEFDQQKVALLSTATDQAKAEGGRLLDEARKAADSLSAKRQQVLREDAINLNKAVGLKVQGEVFAIARKALADLAKANLEERMVGVFIERLHALDGKAKADIAEALKTVSAPAVVRSAFDLPGPQRDAIQKALNEAFSTEVNLRFEAAPHLVGGIEITANGQKLAWSIADYLSNLEKEVGELVMTKDKTKAVEAARIGQPAKPEPKTP